VKTEPVLVSPKREDCDSAEQVSMLKNCLSFSLIHPVYHQPGNTKGGSITAPLTSCLTGLESAE
jgi:hypothetical protein